MEKFETTTDRALRMVAERAAEDGKVLDFLTKIMKQCPTGGGAWAAVGVLSVAAPSLLRLRDKYLGVQHD